MFKLIFSLLVLNFLFSCQSKTLSEDEIIFSLVDNMMSNQDVQQLKTYQGKVVILKSEFCKDNNCEPYFRNAKIPVQFYSREDAFMRAINQYIVIEDFEINGENSSLEYQIRQANISKDFRAE